MIQDMKEMYYKKYCEGKPCIDQKNLFIHALSLGSAHELTVWKNRISDLVRSAREDKASAEDVLERLEDWA